MEFEDIEILIDKLQDHLNYSLTSCHEILNGVGEENQTQRTASELICLQYWLHKEIEMAIDNSDLKHLERIASL